MMTRIVVTLFSIIIVGIIALQYQSFKIWLLWGVSEAEEFFGSGTGQLKLRYVYNLAVDKYPLIAKLTPFSLFSKLVDLALDAMREMIETNETIAGILQPGTEEVIQDGTD